MAPCGLVIVVLIYARAHELEKSTWSLVYELSAGLVDIGGKPRLSITIQRTAWLSYTQSWSDFFFKAIK